jgi:hypothetical protein
MPEDDILHWIAVLEGRQKDRRDAAARGEITRARELADLADLEEEVDQAWDLERQRRALRESGRSDQEARPRPFGDVEAYQQ